jgi:LemA protein
MGITSIVGWVVIAVLAVAVIAMYNRLIRLRNAIANAYVQIDVQL